MQVLLILNDPPYGTERTYNGLRLALALATSDPEITVTVFLMADAIVAAKSGQKTPDGCRRRVAQPPLRFRAPVRSKTFQDVLVRSNYDIEKAIKLKSITCPNFSGGRSTSTKNR